jgi:hypothetical protein
VKRSGRRASCIFPSTFGINPGEAVYGSFEVTCIDLAFKPNRKASLTQKKSNSEFDLVDTLLKNDRGVRVVAPRLAHDRTICSAICPKLPIAIRQVRLNANALSGDQDAGRARLRRIVPPPPDQQEIRSLLTHGSHFESGRSF